MTGKRSNKTQHKGRKKPRTEPGPLPGTLFETMDISAPPPACKEEPESEVDNGEEENPFVFLGQTLPAGNVKDEMESEVDDGEEERPFVFLGQTLPAGNVKDEMESEVDDGEEERPFVFLGQTLPAGNVKDETESEVDDCEEEEPFVFLGQTLPAGNVKDETESEVDDCEEEEPFVFLGQTLPACNGHKHTQTLPAGNVCGPKDGSGDRIRRSSRTRTPSKAVRSDSSDTDQSTDEREPILRGSSPFSSDTQSSEEQTTSSTAVPPVGRKRGGGRPRNGDPAANHPVWHDTNWQPKDIPFTANPGPRNAAADLQSDQPVDFLELFMTDELLQTICVQTNLYAEQYIRAEEGQHPHARTHAWKEVTVGELKSFFGLLFLTGIVRKPDREMYWSTDEPIATPYFNKTMSRNRFQIIWRFLHFNDNDSVDATDRLYKIRPCLDYLLTKFRDMFIPSENISIDEGMLLWRGRLSFKVYNPQKPIKYGIKSYILCDSGTGYCFSMKPYCGQYSSLEDTVVFLLGGLAGYGYRLYMDNYYNSVQMCELLLGLQTHVCGTLRKNRGEPPAIREVTNSDLKIGERIMRHNDTVMLVAWRDKRIVRMITTLHQDEMQTVLVKQKGQVPQAKPACVVAYNQSMNGVDRLDQNISYYPFVRKSAKWTNKFVVYLFQICLLNAFTIYKAKNPGGNCKCLSSFILSVVKSWTTLRRAPEEASDDPPEQNPRAPYNTDPQSRLNGNVAGHELVPLPPTPKRTNPTRKCRVCARKGKRSETRFRCKSCGVPLHSGKCTTLYHSKVKYAQ